MQRCGQAGVVLVEEPVDPDEPVPPGEPLVEVVLDPPPEVFDVSDVVLVPLAALPDDEVWPGRLSVR